jgi:hypothetical protein
MASPRTSASALTGPGFLNAVYGAGVLLGGVVAGALSSRVAPAFIWSATASVSVFVFFVLSPARDCASSS